jgi:phospholipid transport system substrate-binding protein
MSAKELSRRTFLGLLAAGPLAARAAQAADPAASGPVAPIERLDAALLQVMKEGQNTSFNQRVASLTPAIEGALNVAAILRLAVGPSWTTLSPDQQASLLSAFRQYTVATFVENFDSYDGQRLTVSPQTRALPDGAQVVHTEVISRSGLATHSIDYVMRRAPDGQWRASDILADGTISRVAVLRSDFAAMLARGGPSALQASLERKTAALASG